MDSRDSSTTTSAAATVIAAATSDEDGLITIRSGLAKDAALLFQSRRYSDCLEILNQLNKKKQDDPKVLHNIAVAEYFHGGCTDPRKLLEVLNNVKRRSEELAHAAGEQLDTSIILNNGISGPKGHQFSAATTAGAYTYEFDTSVAKLNIAVVLSHLHEYANALSVLEPLYQNIEPLDETTALHICLLLLDIALASNAATRAAHVILYLEKTFTDITGQGDGGNVAHHQSANALSKTFSAPSNSPALDSSNSESVASTNMSEAPLGRSLSEEADSYETLLSTLDIGGQNLARAPGFTITNDLSRTTDRAAPVVDLKLKLHLYMVRLLLFTRNLKASKREVKLAVNMARGSDSSTALLLKSQLEYARGNHRKAIKLLMASNSRTEPWMESMFHNNLGCIYHQLKKHHTSTYYFSKALKSSSSLRSEKPLKLLTFSQDRSLSVVYNCGLQYLACGKSAVAARCFQKASLIFYNKPLLWLRIAECCLLALEKGLLNSSGDRSSEVRVQVIGTGKWRHLLVEDGTSRNRFLELTKQKNGSLGSDDKVDLSISFGRQCLLNALHLLDGFELKSPRRGSSALKEDETSDETPFHSSNHKNLAGRDSKASNMPVASNANGDVKDSKGGASSSSILQSSISLYEDSCRRENNMVKQAVLADLAYVELNLENPLKALMAAISLLKLPDCSRIYIFLGHVYAAEALCHLNRPKEASEHLVAYVDGSNNTELPYSEEDREKLGVGKGGDIEETNGGSVPPKNVPKEEYPGILFLKPEEARGSLYVNLAAISAVQGDLEQAHRFATEALSMIPRNTQAILTSVYVDLLLGRTEIAVSKLKQFDGVRFLPTTGRSGS